MNLIQIKNDLHIALKLCSYETEKNNYPAISSVLKKYRYSSKVKITNKINYDFSYIKVLSPIITLEDDICYENFKEANSHILISKDSEKYNMENTYDFLANLKTIVKAKEYILKNKSFIEEYGFLDISPYCKSILLTCLLLIFTSEHENDELMQLKNSITSKIDVQKINIYDWLFFLAGLLEELLIFIFVLFLIEFIFEIPSITPLMESITNNIFEYLLMPK